MMKPTTSRAGHARFALVAALYKQQLGEVIRARRKELGLSQKDLADRANVEEPQTVSRWERGINGPTDLDAVARALEWTADEMLRRLTPIGQKERREIFPAGPTQLDRIEAKLNDLIVLLTEVPDAGPAEVLEEEADRLDAQRNRSDATPKRTQRKRKAP